MMRFEYETDRMIMRVLNENATPAVMAFYENNLGDFEYAEPLQTDAYSPDYFQSILQYEYQMIVKQELVRYWAIPKDNPYRIIGTVSFRDLKHQYFHSCETGYKVDRDYRGKGYGRELLSFGIELMVEEFKMHRIEATVLPENTASIRLLEGLGFEREGYLRDKLQIEGVYRDHYLYALVED